MQNASPFECRCWDCVFLVHSPEGGSDLLLLSCQTGLAGGEHFDAVIPWDVKTITRQLASVFPDPSCKDSRRDGGRVAEKRNPITYLM